MANTKNTQDFQPQGKGPTPITDANKPSTNKTPASPSGEPFTTKSETTSSGSSTGAATATARSFLEQAKETAGQAYEAVTDKAATKLDEQKSTLSGGLSTVADSVRQVSQNLGSSPTDSALADAAAKYTNTAARTIEDVAGYFETKSVRDMARDLENFARRNPAVFIGAAFGIGLLAARFLKSTKPGEYYGDREFDRAGQPRQIPQSGGTSQRSSVPDSTTANPI